MRAGEVIRQIEKKFRDDFINLTGVGGEHVDEYAREISLRIYDAIDAASDYDSDIERGVAVLLGETAVS